MYRMSTVEFIFNLCSLLNYLMKLLRRLVSKLQNNPIGLYKGKIEKLFVLLPSSIHPPGPSLVSYMKGKQRTLLYELQESVLTLKF